MSIARPTLADRHWQVRLAELAQDWRFAVLFLLAFSILIRFIDIDRPPHVDELYHIMAAKGWLAYGEPRIADGLYTRAELFTILVAGALGALGDSLVAARLPSVVAGSVLVVAVFLWTRTVAGSATAWIAALLLCLSALSFQLFLWARFYALHALLFWLGAIGIYALVEERFGLRTRLGLGLGASVAFLLALHLQLLTLLGLAGIALWFCLAHGLRWLWSGHLGPSWRVLAILGAAAIVTVILLDASGVLDSLWQRYRWAPPHSVEHRNELWFYHLFFLQRYPAIWPFFPFLALIALAEKPRPALFCFCVFTVIFVLASFGGMKDQRYLLFAMPFFYALCGMALAPTLGRLWALLNAATERAATALLPSGWGRPAKWLALGASLLFLIFANGSTAKTALMFVGVRLSAEGQGIGVGSEYDGDAWAAASAPLRPWLEQASLVVTMGEEFTLYYVGDYDVLIDRNRVVELGDREFVVDTRNGRPVVSKAASLELILDCYRDGVIIVDTEIWRQPNRVGDVAADLIEQRTTRIDLPTTPRIKLFRWERSGSEIPEGCADLPKVTSGSGGPTAGLNPSSRA
jgi:4-amino-4-deoxy-L-arabinose transferase-like glycosyltransferase